MMPKYKVRHCPHCTFLGHYQDEDIYFCTQGQQHLYPYSAQSKAFFLVCRDLDYINTSELLIRGSRGGFIDFFVDRNYGRQDAYRTAACWASSAKLIDKCIADRIIQ